MVTALKEVDYEYSCDISGLIGGELTLHDNFFAKNHSACLGCG
jgi:hypothetical protein